jgi:hypothetical protein
MTRDLVVFIPKGFQMVAGGKQRTNTGLLNDGNCILKGCQSSIWRPCQGKAVWYFHSMNSWAFSPTGHSIA